MNDVDLVALLVVLRAKKSALWKVDLNAADLVAKMVDLKNAILDI